MRVGDDYGGRQGERLIPLTAVRSKPGESAPMPRVLWKGAIGFGLVHIPVGLYPAEQRNNFDLTMLDRRDMKPTGFKRYNKETGRNDGRLES